MALALIAPRYWSRASSAAPDLGLDTTDLLDPIASSPSDTTGSTCQPTGDLALTQRRPDRRGTGLDASIKVIRLGPGAFLVEFPTHAGPAARSAADPATSAARPESPGRGSWCHQQCGPADGPAPSTTALLAGLQAYDRCSVLPPGRSGRSCHRCVAAKPRRSNPPTRPGNGAGSSDWTPAPW